MPSLLHDKDSKKVRLIGAVGRSSAHSIYMKMRERLLFSFILESPSTIKYITLMDPAYKKSGYKCVYNTYI